MIKSNKWTNETTLHDEFWFYFLQWKHMKNIVYEKKFNFYELKTSLSSFVRIEVNLI